MPFILIGDSGQRDPEIYRALLHDHPGRIPAIYIRNVSSDPERTKAIRTLAAEVTEAGSSLVLADDTLAAARHAAEHGWIGRTRAPAGRKSRHPARRPLAPVRPSWSSDYLSRVSARPRLTPFDLAFAELADERFPGIRDALVAEGTDPADRDAFLLNRDVVTLVRELRPEEGAGEEIGQLAALVHHVYLFWNAGQPVVVLGTAETAAVLAGDLRPPARRPACPVYFQLPERRIWAEPVPSAPHEPLDGCFVHAAPGEAAMRVLGIFGLHPDRPGFTVVEAAGPRIPHLARPDGSALYAPLLPGGAAAGLHSLAGGEELLELGYRMSGRADEQMSRDPS